MENGVDLPTAIVASAAAVVGLWTYLICKLIFLGKPRDVLVKAFGVEIIVRSHGAPALEKENEHG